MADTGRDATPGRQVPPVLGQLVGQPRAQAILASAAKSPVHAYLFVGPRGTGKTAAAIAFAAALVCPSGGCGACPACRDALAGLHPDVVVVERQGASISADEARQVTVLAQRSPRVAARQVIVLVDFHLVDRFAPVLLKTIEEPPPGTVFLVLAELVPESFMTIASRCVPVEFSPLDTATIEVALVAEGIAAEVASGAAAGAAGRLDRARLLARDPGFARRQARWRAVPEQLDGTGTTVSRLAGELIGGADELVAVLRLRQDEELANLTAAAEGAGERQLTGRRGIEDRFKREQRRVRTDELRAGFASLALAYRERLAMASTQGRRLAPMLQGCRAIDEATEALVRNPNEALLLQGLLVKLDAG